MNDHKNMGLKLLFVLNYCLIKQIILKVEYLVLKADVIKFVSISLNKFQIQWKSALSF